MKIKYCLFAYLFLSSSIMGKSLATELSASTVSEDFLKRIKYTKAVCFKTDPSDVLTRISSDIFGQYQNSADLNDISSAFDFFGNSIDFTYYMVHGDAYHAIYGSDELELVFELTDTLKRHDINTKQKAAVANCIAANMIKYRTGRLFSLKAKFSSIDTALKNGYGQCTEYSRILNALLFDLGIQSNIVGKRGHAFVSFIDEGKRYYLDPTRTKSANAFKIYQQKKS